MIFFLVRYFFICITALILLLQCASAHAFEKSFLQKSSLTFDVTYASQYLGRRGVSFFGDGPAVHPSVHANIGGSGVYAGIWGALSLEENCKEPFGDPCSDWDEYDYYFGFSRWAWEGDPFATNYDLNYTYLAYIKQERLDDQEIGLSVSHPNLLPVIGWSRPFIFWGVYYLWPVHGDGDGRREVKLGLGYDIPISTEIFNLFVNALWADRAGGAIDKEGIMRYRGGISTTFKVARLAVKPALYYQKAMMETDPEDWIKSEFWFKLSISGTI